MAKMVELNFDPDEKTLRQFGWIALVGFGLIALLAWNEWLIFSFGLGEWRPVVAGTFLGLGVLTALIGLVYPKANKPIFVGLSLLAFPIGFVLSYAIMGLLFFGLITPVGLFFKLTGRDPLNRGYDDGVDSYWTPARATRPNEAYFKQF